MHRSSIVRRGMRRFAVAVLGVSGLIAAQAPPVSPALQPPNNPAATLQQHDARYHLRKGDSFAAEFAFSPEFNQSVVVEPDGYATLKEVGSVYVEGHTVPELTAMLKHAYAGILHDPVIAIALKEFDRPYFIASGQVTRPGKYDLRGPLTLAEAVALAGGFNNDAKRSQVVLFHPAPNGLFETRLVDVKQLLARRNLNNDIFLQPGDLVYVPESRIGKLRKFMPSTAVGAYYNPAFR